MKENGREHARINRQRSIQEDHEKGKERARDLFLKGRVYLRMEYIICFNELLFSYKT